MVASSPASEKKVAEFVNETMGVQLLTSDIVACHVRPRQEKTNGLNQ